MARIEGAFAAVLISEGKLIGFRDPDGIRPLVLGQLGDDYLLASEDCAFDLLGAEPVRELQPGELVVVDAGGVHAERAVEPRDGGALCIFEFIYFARPDSTLRGVELHGARVRMGERLAAESPAEADLVMAIPDSGTPAAIGFARASGIPFQEGLIKNRYVGRTFIQPDQAPAGARDPHEVQPADRGAREAGRGRRRLDRPRLDHASDRGDALRVGRDARCTCASRRRRSSRRASTGSTWPARTSCSLRGREIEEVREEIGATSLVYLSLDGLQEATRRPADSFCRACLTKSYPTRIPDNLRLAKLRFERAPA